MSTRWAIVVAAIAGALIAAAVWIVLPSAPTRPSPASPLAVHTSFASNTAAFGDTVTARIEVVADSRAVRPETLHAVYSVSPLTLVAPVSEHRVTLGKSTVVSYELRAACVSERCISASGRRALSFTRVQVDAERRAGGRTSAGAAWPSLEIDGRVTAADAAAARPAFRTETSLTPVTYRIPPATLLLLLEIAAVLLVGGGFALGAATLLQSSQKRRTRGAAPDALREALRLARESRTRAEPDRRSALGLVARLLAQRDRPLARRADDLAWSRPAPTPERLTHLIDDVEQETQR